MVNKKHNDNPQEELEITNDETPVMDLEVEEAEDNFKDVIKALRDKLKRAEAEKSEVQNELQRQRADFLNARKRLDDEKNRNNERNRMSHVEELIPLCDSFQMAMNNKEVWEKADENWRKGIEGIYAQLQRLLAKYQVEIINPKGAHFDPQSHEALGTVAVDKEAEHEKVVQVIQSGYSITHSTGTKEIIRPARVTIGEYSKGN